MLSFCFVILSSHWASIGVEFNGVVLDGYNKTADGTSKYLIFSNSIEILKQISFIDTPGLNSRSHKDTNESLEILEVCSGIIWLSLIDNAARAGELKELEMLPKRLKNHALCLLNQKDKLNENEIARVLEHCKVTYNKYFSAILPISAKLELMGDKNSGFDEIRKFLKAFDKEGFIKENMRETSPFVIFEILLLDMILI